MSENCCSIFLVRFLFVHCGRAFQVLAILSWSDTEVTEIFTETICEIFKIKKPLRVTILQSSFLYVIELNEKSYSE